MTSSAERPARKGGSAGLAVVAIGLAVAIALLAWFQEPIGYFFRMRTWDKEAPVRAVREFLEAGKKGDQAKADRLLGTRDMQPLVKNDKWLGYFIATPAGKLEFEMSELAPAEFPKDPQSEFQYIGEGTAEVVIPDRSGKNVRYRLAPAVDGWKIKEILGGKVGS